MKRFIEEAHQTSDYLTAPNAVDALIWRTSVHSGI